MPKFTKKPSLDPLKMRVRTGVVNGLWYGIPLALFSVIGALIDYDAWRERIGGSPYVIAVFYLIASMAIGALTGAIERQLRSRRAALAFGFVVMIPTGVVALLVTQGAAYAASSDGMIVIVAIAALIGPLCANIIRGK